MTVAYVQAHSNLLAVACRRPHEGIQLMGLRLIGTILVATPPEKRAGRDPPSGNPLEAHERSYLERVAQAPLFKAMEDSIMATPFTPALRHALTDVLLGVAAPRQVIGDPYAQRRVAEVQ